MNYSGNKSLIRLFFLCEAMIVLAETSATHEPSTVPYKNNLESSYGPMNNHESSSAYKEKNSSSNCTCVSEYKSNEKHHNDTHTGGNEHHSATGNHGDTGHHTSPHLVVWPSAVSMMIFISVSSYLFFHFYSRKRVKELKTSEEVRMLEEAIIATTTAGAAVPALAGFSDDCVIEECQIFKDRSKENRRKSVKVMFRHMSMIS